MKIISRFVFASMILLFLFAFAYAIHETQPAETQITLPPADAAKLYDYVTKTRPYTEWSLWPGKGKMYKGTEPHGALLTTYINDAAAQSVKKNKLPLPDGAIIAKENYTPDRKLDALTVMYKVKGYNPPAGDWFWAKYGADGRTVASGKVEACINCHGKKKDNDYILTGEIGKK